MSWKVPNMWKNGECWIIGGGPSIPRQFDVPEEVIQDVMSGRSPVSVYSPYFSAIHQKHTIGINMSFRIGDWLDMVFFGDAHWYTMNKVDLALFPGIKVACNSKIGLLSDPTEEIKIVHHNGQHPEGITMKPGLVSWNKNSGAAAISIAVQAGATRIILLGFDMTLGMGNQQHWHSLYPKGDVVRQQVKQLPFDHHLKGFGQIKQDADALGIEIINASPNSAITEFEKISVKELL